MKEEFLHYLWKYGLYDKESLADSEGNQITIVSPGLYNHDSGPDFFDARIMIAGTLWAGNVEIHILASHFNLHCHQNDPAYNNVILHAVAINDATVINSAGNELLTVELKFDKALYERYENLVNNPCTIACQDHAGRMDPVLVRQWLSALAVERLGRKSEAIMEIARETGNDWEEVFYRMICRYFGFRVNSEPFEMLARALPFKIIRKHSDNIFTIEALLYGAAGMLDEGMFREAINDRYYVDLIREFRVFSSKYSIKPLHGFIWKFGRLRPVNFPTLRISQLAHMLSVSGGLFSRVIEQEDHEELKKLFEVPASEYWEDHFIFGKKALNITRRTGSQATDILLINAIIPVMFVYGKSRGRQDIIDRAVSFLECMAPEENIIINEWKAAGIEAGSAFHSQALLQLRNEYCRKRRCLDCRIGGRLVSMGLKFRDEDQLMMEP